MNLDHHKLYSVTEAADVFNISIHTVRDWIKKRQIPFIKLGRRVLFRPEDLIRFINSCAVKAKKSNLKR